MQEESKGKLLSDSKDECGLHYISGWKVAVIATAAYVVIMLGVYCTKIAHREGHINIPLYLCIAFTVLCMMAALAVMIKQRFENKNTGASNENNQGLDYDEASYWEGELSITDEEDDRTVLIMPERKKSKFMLRTMAGEIISISTFPFVIGKVKERVDYCIEDATISRIHAKLDECDEEVLLVTDLNSTNGTFVGDRRLKANEVVKLGLNEMLTIGDHSFQLIKD